MSKTLEKLKIELENYYDFNINEINKATKSVIQESIRENIAKNKYDTIEQEKLRVKKIAAEVNELSESVESREKKAVNFCLSFLTFLSSKNKNHLFNAFSDLSIFLLESGQFNAKEYYEIIINVIIKNISVGIEDISITNQNIEKEKNNVRDELCEQGLSRENLAFVEKKLEEMIIAHKVIKRHCLSKKMEESDIKYIINALKVLEVHPTILNNIKGFLEAKIQKEKGNSNEIKINFSKKEDETKKIVLSTKEYNKIYHIIQSMYNLEKEWAIKPLNLDELIYLVSLMFKIGVKEEIIIRCIKNVYKEFDNKYEDPIEFFNKYYEKLMFYQDNEEIKHSINLIKSYLEEMNNSVGEESKIWQSFIKEEMIHNYKLLEKEYTYELVKGKSLSYN